MPSDYLTENYEDFRGALEQIGYDINDAEKREEHGYDKLEMKARIRENIPMFPKNN